MCVYANLCRLVYLLSVPEKLEKHSVMLLKWAQVSLLFVVSGFLYVYMYMYWFTIDHSKHHPVLVACLV